MGSRGGGHKRQRQRRPIGPFIVIGLGVIVLLVAFYLLGSYGPDNEETPPPSASATTTPVATSTPAPKGTSKKKSSSSSKKKKAPTRVSLRLTATNSVYACVEDATGKAVVNAVTLAKGQKTKTFTSKRFRANFGNGNVRMTVGGKTYKAAATSRPIGYEFRPGKRPKKLSESVRAGLCAL
jgi:cytoskeleton protein RodZ